MTAQLSAGQIKTGKSKQDKPRAGTKLRADYDALRRGERIAGHNKDALQNFYGMDIVNGKLRGEWEGPIYVPAERIVSHALA